MNASAAPRLDVRAIYETVIDRLLNGDMKDKRNSEGWTYIEQLAKQLLEDPAAAAELTASARLPAIKASIERAAALNAPKLALLEFARHRKPSKEGLDRTSCPARAFGWTRPIASGDRWGVVSTFTFP
jgi:hypothetical protein